MLQNEKNIDNTNSTYLWIEYLRIFCMFWIILFHFSDHGTVIMETTPLSINWLMLAMARLGGGIGNCIFVLITGYLMYEKQFKLMRIIKLWFETLFYSILSFVIINCVNSHMIENMGSVNILKVFFPIISNRYWFISTYILLGFLIPFLNKLIDTLNVKNHIYLMVLMFLISSVIPTFTLSSWMTSKSNIDEFILLYLIGSFIKKNNLHSIHSYKYFVLFIIVLFGMLCSEIVLKVLLPSHFDYFVSGSRKTPTVIASILLFLFAKNMKINLPKFFLVCSRSVFGVYLIHIGDLNIIFFKNIFDISKIFNSYFFIILLMLYALFIFIICVTVDFVRILFVEKNIMPYIIKISNNIEKLFDFIIQKLSYLINKI